MALPDCFDCKYGGLEHPCRAPDGHYDFAKAAKAYIARGRQIARDFDSGDFDHDSDDQDDDWIGDCEFELVQDHPDLLLPLIFAAMDACETPRDAAWLAAGTIESALVKHGPALIDGLERVAAKSAKARYILSGVWSQSGSVDAGVWARLGRAIGASGRMSDDPREPSDGSPPIVLDDAAAVDLMRERVSDAVRSAELDG